MIPVLQVVGVNADPDKSIILKKLMTDVLQNQNTLVGVLLAREPENIYDSNAIKVLVNDMPIGYIAKADQHYFDGIQHPYYKASIVSWGVFNNGDLVYVYIQPYI